MKNLILVIALLASSMYAQEIRRPTVETQGVTAPLCSTGGATLTSGYVGAINFYDAGGESTLTSWIYYAPTDDAPHYGSEQYSGFAAGSTYTSLNLVIYSASGTNSDYFGISPRSAVEYSTNGGSTWTTVYNTTATRGLTRDTIALSPSQDLTALRVRVCSQGATDYDPDYGSSYSIRYVNGYDIRTEGMVSGGLADPTISIGTGAYTNDVSTSVNDATPGAILCVRTDGTAPTATTPGTCDTGSTTYSTLPATISIAATGTVLKVLATKAAGVNSAVITATYTLSVATPVLSPAPGTFTSAQTLAASSSTTGAVLHYTTNGVSPTCSDTTNAPNVSAGTVTVKAIACKANYATSPIVTGAYTVNISATPTISPTGNSYLTAQSVSMTCTTPSSTIRYTTDGSQPTPGSTPYSAPFSTVASGVETVKAICTASGYGNSQAVSVTYNINPTFAAYYTDDGSQWYTTELDDAKQRPLDWLTTRGMFTANGGAAAPDGSRLGTISVAKDPLRGVTCGNGTQQCYRFWRSGVTYKRPTAFGQLPGGELVTLTGFSGITNDQGAEIYKNFPGDASGQSGVGVHCNTSGGLSGIRLAAIENQIYLFVLDNGTNTPLAQVGYSLPPGTKLSLLALGSNPTIVKPLLNGSQIPGMAETYSIATASVQSGNPCIAVMDGSSYNFSALAPSSAATPTAITWTPPAYPTYGPYGWTNADGSPNPTMYSAQGWVGVSPAFGPTYDMVQVSGSEYGAGAAAATISTQVEYAGYFSPNHWIVATLAKDVIDLDNHFDRFYMYVQHRGQVPSDGTPHCYDTTEYFANVQPDYQNYKDAPGITQSQVSNATPGGEFSGTPFLHLGKLTPQSVQAFGCTNNADTRNLAVTSYVPMKGDKVMVRYDRGWVTAWCKDGGRGHLVTTPGGHGCPSSTHFVQVAAAYDTDLLNASGVPGWYSAQSVSTSSGGVQYPVWQNMNMGSVGNLSDPCATVGACTIPSSQKSQAAWLQ